MQPNHAPRSVWITWMTLAAALVIAFGLALVVAPGLTRQAFAALAYFDPDRIDSLGPEAVRYISLAHAVLGSVMAGWGVALLLVARGPFAAGEPIGWNLVAASVLVWFVPDTAYSLWAGFWQNSILNVAFLALFAVPLAATRHMRRRNGA